MAWNVSPVILSFVYIALLGDKISKEKWGSPRKKLENVFMANAASKLFKNSGTPQVLALLISHRQANTLILVKVFTLNPFLCVFSQV
jgi:hypothetical protein